MEIKIKYHSEHSKIKKIAVGDWIDLSTAEDTILHGGIPTKISLGVSMEIPKGYEAHLIVRSSTFDNWLMLQTNGMGIIDNSYSGDNDVWKLPVYPLTDTFIPAGTRIAQFRIIPKMPQVDFIEVETLGNADRGGFGSTGEK